MKPLSLFCGQFAFEEDYLTKYLICPICDMVLRNPMRLHSCGHTYCDKCINTNTCQLCQSPFELKQPDLIAANLVADSFVKCLAKDCPFRGTYESYMGTHKNSCRMKHYNGLDNWMEKVKESLSEEPRSKPMRPVTINCEQIEIPDNDICSVLIQERSRMNKASELQSLIIDNKSHKKIDVESLYQINVSNLGRVLEQTKEKEQPAPRRCQYGKYCKLMLEDGGCPYIHPEKDRRRQYELQKWANIPVFRPSAIPEPTNDLQKLNMQDTQKFLNDFFPSAKPSLRKKEVEIVPPPRSHRPKNNVIEL